MRRSIRFAVMPFALFAPVSAAAAAGLGDVQAGFAYARANCAQCHDADGESQMSRPVQGPSFKVVAQAPGITRTALQVFFRTPHRAMPNFIIPQEDKDNLIAFILSLKAEK